MAIFTKAEDLFGLFNQSVGGGAIEGGQPGYETRRFFHQKAFDPFRGDQTKPGR